MGRNGSPSALRARSARAETRGGEQQQSAQGVPWGPAQLTHPAEATCCQTGGGYTSRRLASGSSLVETTDHAADNAPLPRRAEEGARVYMPIAGASSFVDDQPAWFLRPLPVLQPGLLEVSPSLL